MTHRLFWLPFFALLALCAPLTVRAEEYKPDDRVIFDVSAEDWVTTKTARVVAAVEASVSGATAGTTRAAMTKALDDLVKAEWRLISFNRSQDQTGLERWSALYEARVSENLLSGINENAKKVSKPGLQLSVSSIDFSPTLDETQAALGLLRAKIYKMANDQLAALNAALPGRGYRIALINFSPDMMDGGTKPMMLKAMRAGGHMDMAAGGEGMVAAPAALSAPMERSEKINLTAHVVLAVTPPAVPAAAPSK